MTTILLVSSGRKGIAPQAVEHIVPRRKNVYQNILAGNVRIFLAALIVPVCAFRRFRAGLDGVGSRK